MSYPSQIVAPAAWLAILATIATILLLASLHVLSPKFSLAASEKPTSG
jgi:hypothetical protein